MSTIKSHLLLAVGLLCSAGLFATDYYVAKNGNDANVGTEAAPFLTISKAASLMVAGDVCYVKEGTYREVLDPANGGTAGAPIVFRAFGEDKVTISATEPVTDWSVHEGAIYKADLNMGLGRQDMLYFDEEPMDYARWPNNTDGDPFTIDAMTVESGTAGTINATELPDLDWTGGYVWYLGAHSGTSWTRLITGTSGNRIDFQSVDINRWPFNPHNPTVFRNGNRGRFYVFGVLDALDNQREWYHDDATNTVYFQAPGDGNPEGKVEYAVRTRTIFLNKPYITVEGINTFGGMVNLKADNCTVRGGELRHGYQSLDELDNTDAQVGEGSVWVQASNILIEDNLIEGGSMNGISVQGWGGVSDITMKGNVIREFNTVGNHSSPIRCRAPRSRIISNTIAGGGRDGIFIPADDCEIAWNDVSDVMRINNDGGLFYVVGNEDDKNTSIHHNWFHDSFGPEYADGRCAGIYLDNDSKGYDVHHNVVWNISWSAVQMNWAANNNDIFNNSFWNVDQAMGIWLNGRVQVNNRIWNNYSDVGPWEGQDIADNIINATDQFENPDAEDFRPAGSSVLVDAGRVIAGITDGFRGAAPDVGAYERGNVLWKPGAPRAGNATTAVPTFLAPALRAQIMPNPTRGRSSLNFVLERRSDLSWVVTTATGRVVRQGLERNLRPGEQRLELDLRNLPTGTYFVVGATNAGGFSERLILQ